MHLLCTMADPLNPRQILRNALFEVFVVTDGLGDVWARKLVVDALNYLGLSEQERDAKEQAEIERAESTELQELLRKQYRSQFPC